MTLHHSECGIIMPHNPILGKLNLKVESSFPLKRKNPRKIQRFLHESIIDILCAPKGILYIRIIESREGVLHSGEQRRRSCEGGTKVPRVQVVNNPSDSGRSQSPSKVSIQPPVVE